MMKRYLLLFMILFTFTAMAVAQYSGDYPLQTADVTFTGEFAGDNAGYHASFIGDVNNDGFDDILIAAPLFDANPDDPDPTKRAKDNGKVYLIFGRADGWDGPFDLAMADASFIGEAAGNKASHDLFGVGDINGDGIDDFAIGVKFILRDSDLRVGKTYIFFGKQAGWEKDVSIGTADASLIGETSTSEAAHVYPCGDLNGDGFHDLIIGAGFNDDNGEDAGKCYVVFGKPTEQWSQDFSLSEADASFIGEEPGDWAGHRVAGVGDINGDGFDDFVIGANGRDVDLFPNLGITYVIYGKAEGWQRNVSLADAGASILGYREKHLNSGWTVSPAGDTNGDGLKDFIIGGRGKSRAMLVLGQTEPYGKLVDVREIAATIIIGESNNDYFANDIRHAGDINKDGLDDFIIGAPENDAVVNNGGRAYLFYGRNNWPKELSAADADAMFTGENENDWAGWTAASGGDVDNNGLIDILIGAPNYDDGPDKQDAGKVYLLLTQPLSLRVIYPNGSETLYVGQTEDIRWTVDADIARVKIEISYDNGVSWQVLADSAPNTGRFQWQVTGPVSDACLVRIQDAGGGDKIDQSDLVFAISDHREINITSPVPGGSWEAGINQKITWTSVNTTGFVSILLSRDNGATWESIADSTEDDGRYDWTPTKPASENCLLAITDMDGDPADTTDATFEITVTPMIKVTIPNGGQLWPLEVTHTIAWESRHIGGEVKIELSRDNGETWETIADTTLNDGIHKWVATGPESPNCLIRISDLAGQASDVSDAVFTIGNLRELTVLAPNGGETWLVGEDATITWQANYDSGAVNVLLSPDNGVTWQLLATDVFVGNGQFVYKVEEIITDSALVKIKDEANGVEDVSDALFLIRYPTGVAKRSALLPDKFSLEQNYPNPFNPETRIAFSIPTAAQVELTIFNIRGEMVRKLVDRYYQPGVYEIQWDGRDDNHNLLPSGIYFYKIRAAHHQQVRRMTLVK